MIRINLIPHRAAFRQKQIIEHIVALVSVIFLAVVVVMAVDVVASNGLNVLQEERIDLEKQNKTLSKKIGELRNLDTLRKDVEGKLAIVDELQAGRFRSLITFAAIANATPQNIWVISIQNQSDRVQVGGYGESSQAVASFMRSLEKEEVFSDVTLVVDTEAMSEGFRVRNFSLTLHRLTLAEQQNKGGEPDGNK